MNLKITFGNFKHNTQLYSPNKNRVNYLAVECIGNSHARQIRHGKSPNKIAIDDKKLQGKGNYTHLLNNNDNYTNYLTPFSHQKITFILTANRPYGLLINFKRNYRG